MGRLATNIQMHLEQDTEMITDLNPCVHPHTDGMGNKLNEAYVSFHIGPRFHDITIFAPVSKARAILAQVQQGITKCMEMYYDRD